MAQPTGERSKHKDNQNLQNLANQRSEELKSSSQRTSAGETSSASPMKSRGQQTNVDGNVGSANRDVETFESPDRNMGARVGDDRDSRNH